MKIKTGFVTNSSSSSFIIAFPEEIKDIEIVKKYIAEKYSNTVLGDCLNQTPIRIKDKTSLKQVSDEISSGTVALTPYVSYYDREIAFCQREGITSKDLRENIMWSHQFFKEEDMRTVEDAQNHAAEFLQKLATTDYIYILEYGDEDGSYFSEMEHGNIFHAVPNLRVSKH